jgi:hypothetical protein
MFWVWQIPKCPILFISIDACFVGKRIKGKVIDKIYWPSKCTMYDPFLPK